MLAKHINVAVLVTDAYGGFGGISRFNRDLLSALGSSRLVGRVHAFPRSIKYKITEVVPETVVFDRSCANSKMRYIKKCLKLALKFNQKYDLVVCGHINLLSIAWLLARIKRSQLTLVIHGLDAWDQTSNWLNNYLARYVDNVISVSEHTASRFIKWAKVDQNNIIIMPNTVDLDQFNPGKRDATLLDRYQIDGKRVLMTVGRLVSQERCKGFDEVIEILPTILKKYPNVVYMIVGDGDDRARLERVVKQSGLNDAVIFAGQIPESEKEQHYRLADVYVMPSFGEGFGIVYLEAAACGISIVGSSADGSKEALLHGELGALVDPKDASELTAAVEEKILLAKSPPTRNPRVEYFSITNFKRRVDGYIEKMRAPKS